MSQNPSIHMLEGKPILSSFKTASTLPQGYHRETRLHRFDFLDFLLIKIKHEFGNP